MNQRNVQSNIISVLKPSKNTQAFDKFSTLRPIFSEYECCRAKSSEWLEFFIAIVKRFSSYVQETFDFISKIFLYFSEQNIEFHHCF